MDCNDEMFGPPDSDSAMQGKIVQSEEDLEPGPTDSNNEGHNIIVGEATNVTDLGPRIR
ncbi:hypothetical protein SESBI_02481 [Sesbania bispinosa]|nr:hypothetical protein SESBI_02481 [Sesbania bispinosa]